MYVVLQLVVLAAIATSSHGFSPFKRLGNQAAAHTASTSESILPQQQQQQQSSASRVTELYAYNPDKNLLGSKLLSPLSEDELQDLMKEFNITSMDINKDPDLLKWAPSKAFFEKFGFQNNTERYNRNVQDVKAEFYSTYRTPILPQYKTFLSDLMTVYHIQTIDSRYEYCALHAFGICTQYYTIMKGYAMENEIDAIFNTMMTALRLDPVKIREDAKRVMEMVKSTDVSEEDFLNQSAESSELGAIFHGVRKNRFYKYTDAWGVGLGRVMELRGVEPNKDSFDKWADSLRWVFSSRLLQSWDEFSSDQLRMQGVEAMQKQLLIREKKRAATRLEEKAAKFGDKRAALQSLNEAIEERRQQMIQDEMELKKKYDPEGYEKILQADSLAKETADA